MILIRISSKKFREGNNTDLFSPFFLTRQTGSDKKIKRPMVSGSGGVVDKRQKGRGIAGV